jgi:hypothetical protein
MKENLGNVLHNTNFKVASTTKIHKPKKYALRMWNDEQTYMHEEL